MWSGHLPFAPIEPKAHGSWSRTVHFEFGHAQPCRSRVAVSTRKVLATTTVESRRTLVTNSKHRWQVAMVRSLGSTDSSSSSLYVSLR